MSDDPFAGMTPSQVRDFMERNKLAPLPCGCQAGFFLCPEAVRLWDDVGRAFHRGDPDAFNESMLAYRRHFGRAR